MHPTFETFDERRVEERDKGNMLVGANGGVYTSDLCTINFESRERGGGGARGGKAKEGGGERKREREREKEAERAREKERERERKVEKEGGKR